jgi:hypothetical protein
VSAGLPSVGTSAAAKAANTGCATTGMAKVSIEARMTNRQNESSTVAPRSGSALPRMAGSVCAASSAPHRTIAVIGAEDTGQPTAGAI